METRKNVEIGLSQEEVEKIVAEYVKKQFNVPAETEVTVILKKKVTLVSFPE